MSEIFQGLEEKSEEIYYISMKDLQIYFDQIRDVLNLRINQFINNQVEALKLNELINKEIKSPPGVSSNSNSNQANSQASNETNSANYRRSPQNSNSNQLGEMESSNFGSSFGSQEMKNKADNLKTTHSEPTQSHKFPRYASRVLNQWLLDHLEDPFPTAEEKMLLSAKTKISLRQVTNWFVNHRSRKLKTLKRSRKFSNQIRKSFLLSGQKK